MYLHYASKWLYTSVYGHLQTTMGAIQDYVLQTHYKEKAFEIEMFPKTR
jgi:hypothetical protein